MACLAGTFLPCPLPLTSTKRAAISSLCLDTQKLCWESGYTSFEGQGKKDECQIYWLKVVHLAQICRKYLSFLPQVCGSGRKKCRPTRNLTRSYQESQKSWTSILHISHWETTCRWRRYWKDPIEQKAKKTWKVAEIWMHFQTHTNTMGMGYRSLMVLENLCTISA